MCDTPNKNALPMLAHIVAHFNKLDISTFNALCTEMMEMADDRDIEDRTDFTFKKRRAND